MKKLIVFFLLLQTVSCFGQNPNPSVSLDEYIMDEMQAEHFPGVATVIVKNGEIVWLQCYGFADIENGIHSDRQYTVFIGFNVETVYRNGNHATQRRWHVAAQ